MTVIDTAMVLAAGLGTRFRAIAGDRPKPLVPVAGKALIDWSLDLLADAGVSRAVVNVHYKADQVEAHLQPRERPQILISDERDELLETGGGLMKATPLLREGPVFCTNTDAILLNAPGQDSVAALRAGWDDPHMDALLLLVPQANTSGYAGQGDFAVSPTGQLSWDGEGEKFVFTGLQIIHPRLWAGAPLQPQSTKVFWDRAMAEGRIYGLVHQGDWRHVGDPEGYEAAQLALGGQDARS